MDAVLKAAEEHGLKVEVLRPRDTYAPILKVDGEEIKFKLHEAVRGHQRELTKAERQYKAVHGFFPLGSPPLVIYHPTGLLTLAIESYSEGKTGWKDSKHRRIEESLGEFIQGLRAAADYARKRREQQRIEEARRRKEEDRRWKYNRLVERLKQNVTGWEEAERLRAYSAAARRNEGARAGALQAESDLARYLSWVGRYADSLDPTISSGASPDWLTDFAEYAASA